MKKLLLTLLCLMPLVAAQAQCDVQAYREICLKKMPEYFVFSKSYGLDKQVSEHKNVFNKQRAYIIIADSYRTKIEVLKDDGRGNKTLQKVGEGYLSFISAGTGEYIVRFTFDEGDDNNQFCGAAILAFLR